MTLLLITLLSWTQQSLKRCEYLRDRRYEQVFGSSRVSAASRADNIPMH